MGTESRRRTRFAPALRQLQARGSRRSRPPEPDRLRHLSRADRRRARTQSIAVAAFVVAGTLLLAACGATTATAHQGGGGGRVRGGVASYALPVGDNFSWMLPLQNEVNYENYDSNIESGMWRPLYFAGGAGTTGINKGVSLAYPPVFSANDTVVTVDLKRGYRWSDGAAVTTSDVRFFFELEAAGAKSGRYAPYIPGRMPDDISRISDLGQYRFRLYLKHSYNPVWFTGNQLTWIYPLPRQAWDKTCLSCRVGNDAATPAGARAVYTFLYDQSSDLSTYATNPLWQVVDGPWRIKAYNPTTYYAAFVANRRFAGPQKPYLSGYDVYSFASDAAELDAVRSGVVDFGYLSPGELRLTATLERAGYRVKPWRVFYSNMAEFGYTGPDRALVAQLYLRQALQHLVDEMLYLSATLHGHGLLDYGAAPDYPGSSYVSPALRHDPYPYSIAAARRLLAAHGWVGSAGGVDRCERPGVASNDCGAGITRNRPLQLRFMYSTGVESLLQQVEAFATAAASAGIGVTLAGETQTTMFSVAGVCPPGPCDYGLALYTAQEDFGQYVIVPTAGVEFAKGNYWGGGYDSTTEQHLLNLAYDRPGLSYLYKVQDYQQQQVAGLWWPVADYEIVVAKGNLAGWYPLSPYANYRPSTWYFTS